MDGRICVVDSLKQYLDFIVEPTFEDFARNPRSLRHAYLACVATYHAVDWAAFPKGSGNLKKQWREACVQFVIVDMVAHKFKHVISDDEKAPVKEGYIPISFLVSRGNTFNSSAFNTLALNEGGIELRNLHFVIRDCIKFLHQQAIGPT